MKQLISAIVTLIIASAIALPATAKTIYIHDNLRVDMRTGPSLEYRIIDFLRSGTKMQVLQESGEWIQIEANGKEGWIQSQYTSEEPIARDQLAQALKEIQALKQENSGLKSKLSESQSELGGLKSDHSKMTNSTEKLQQELDRAQQTCKNAISTEAAYRQLQEEAELLKVDVEKLKVENIRLSEDNLKSGIQWGAGAVFLGVILAWLIAKSSAKKRRSEW
ncbi:TIGR04211 family SH3 domain-containing protein [Ketobacter alkanivorans]|uniref:TIGR04211 family SH3 domain-containing protein n=1 Tax=Ketobacter alkanivorans TaxID=1917421 RepID=UPI0013152369|nr:TIGR04211 family SH3 domain-containing protein [Ketobacter alkanivorans]MCP5015334.1 TIGR04211 family SH3 domain-containing protein [Ketobacter sp.]